jgi:cytochrome c-type biogenesis protein CcsB
MAVNETLATASNGLVYSAMAIYAGAFVAFSAELAFGSRSGIRSATPTQASAEASGATVRTLSQASIEAPPRPDRFGRIGVALTVLAFALHLGAVVTRGLSVQRVPWGNMYEFSLTAALAVTGAWLFLLWRGRDVRSLGLFVVGPVLLTLGLAVTVLYADAAELIPALKSTWLVIHVSAAVLCAGVFSVGTTASLLYLMQQRWERTGGGGRLAALLPSSASLDRTAYRTLAFAFPLWTFAVVAGAIWAENAWGRYWGWDPKETWAFITWVVYAGYLHARATAGWKGKRAAWIALAGFGCFLFNYFGVNIFLTGLHSYNGL